MDFIQKFRFPVSSSLLILRPMGYVAKLKYSIDIDRIEKVFLNKNNFKDFRDVEKHNMPRASRGLNNYYSLLYKLANYYKEEGKVEKLDELADYIERNLLTNVLPNGEKTVKYIRGL